jgi:arsenite methyltransferase
MKAEELKLIVKEKYGQIAEKGANEKSCDCGSSCCGPGVDYTVFSENYETRGGYNPEADLNLGCGIPTDFARMKAGDHVLDLGSGAGNDCFVARAIVGESCKVTGLDFTEQMINKARENCKKLRYNNVEFVPGDIEFMPFPDGTFDVIISNCVLNLVPNKPKAFSEIYRVLKPGGHLSVSDVVLSGVLPQKIKEAAEMYAGCVSGAIEINDYLNLILQSGLSNVLVQKKKTIAIPDETLLNYLDQSELEHFKKSESGIFSITVNAEKPFSNFQTV